MCRMAGMVEPYKNQMDAFRYEVGRNLLGRNVRRFGI